MSFVGYICHTDVVAHLSDRTNGPNIGQIPITKTDTPTKPSGYMIWEKIGNGNLAIHLQTLEHLAPRLFELQIKDHGGNMIRYFATESGTIYISQKSYQGLFSNTGRWEFTV